MFSRRLTVFHWPTPVGNPFAKGCFESTTGNAPLPAILERGFSPSVFAFASTKRSSITQNLDTQIVHFACPYSSKRSSELKLLDLRFMRILPEGVEFKLPGLTKTSSEVISVFFAKYEEREELCVLRCLQCYIARTSPFRPIIGSNSASQLLLVTTDLIILSNRVLLPAGLSQSWVALALTLLYLKDILRDLRQLGKPGQEECLIGRDRRLLFVFTIGLPSIMFMLGPFCLTPRNECGVGVFSF